MGLIFGISVIFFTILLYARLVSDVVFGSLVSILIFTFLVLFYADRLKEIDIKSLKLVLTDIREESKELKELSYNLSELIAMNSAFQGRWGTHEWEQLRSQVEKTLIERILKDQSLIHNVFKYQDTFKKVDEMEKKGIGDVDGEIIKTLTDHLKTLQNR